MVIDENTPTIAESLWLWHGTFRVKVEQNLP
jgi:hypothetical protein